MADGRRPVRYDSTLALKELAAADPKLGALMERVGPFTLMLQSQHSPFEALLEAIIYQQLHGKAAFAILHRLLQSFGDLHPSPELLLQAPEEQLRGVGLSGAKARALRDLAQKTIDGTVPSLAAIRRMKDEEIVARLTEVRGVGVWTVEMLLMFRLGRPDVLPATDFGVRKGFALTFLRLPRAVAEGRKPVTAEMLPKPLQIARRAEKWRPWRSVASWYMWRACELANSAGATNL